MEKRIKIYVAGAYSADNVMTVLRNMGTGIKESAKLMKLGYSPFCPWLDYHFLFHEPDLTVQDYYAYSMAWLEVSEAMYVLPGYENSKGTLAEIKRAQELEIPIFFNLDLLNAFARQYENQKQG